MNLLTCHKLTTTSIKALVLLLQKKTTKLGVSKQFPLQSRKRLSKIFSTFSGE